MQTKKNEIWVGIFLLAALLAALFVCLKAANVTSIRTEPTYTLYATFDNIGGLKARSPVSIGGVVVGRVADITLDPKTYLPRVTLEIELGTAILKDGDTIQDTKSAMVLEDLIGQFLYGSKGDDNKNSGDAPAAAPGNNETTEPVGTTK